jgi:hypothetical protein
VPTPQRLFRRLGTLPATVFDPLRRAYSWLSAFRDRQRALVLKEVSRIDGLLPLLMKQRNGTPWTDEDRREIRKQLRSLARLSPYILAAVLPGGLLVLPLVAWWLDRRRLRQEGEKTATNMHERNS